MPFLLRYKTKSKSKSYTVLNTPTTNFGREQGRAGKTNSIYFTNTLAVFTRGKTIKKSLRGCFGKLRLNIGVGTCRVTFTQVKKLKKCAFQIYF